MKISREGNKNKEIEATIKPENGPMSEIPRNAKLLKDLVNRMKQLTNWLQKKKIKLTECPAADKFQT